MEPIIAFIAALASLAVSIILIACAITAARALKRLADEAAQLRRILGIVAETQLARGKNEISGIQCANGYAEIAQLGAMPDPHGENAKSSMRPPSKLSNEVRATRLDTIMRQ